jgi:glycosyltransferase involved in cell wall biosynthesis
MHMQAPLVSIFLPSLLIGGAEKALVELANHLSAEGWRTHLVVLSATGPLAEHLSATVELVDLRCNSFRQAIVALARYYKSRRPSVVLTSLYATGLAAIAARFIARHKPKILVGAHNSLQAKVAHPDNVKDKWLLMPLCRILFPLADGFIPVSRGLAKELETLLGLPGNRIRAIYNPVINDTLTNLAAEPVSHPWLIGPASRQYKTLVSVGRLVEQKGYDVLLLALQLAKNSLDCRLIIIGGGPLLSDLENTARQLGISDIVDLVGWQTNPYKFVARADLFVLSSRWEGLANVLIEALACGCPVVSTNCRYGPEEILECGKYGALARVDDPVDLAEKIISSLSSSPPQAADKTALVRRALDFTVEASARQYASYFTEVLTGSTDLGRAQS